MADDNRGGREQRPRRAGSKPPSRSSGGSGSGRPKSGGPSRSKPKSSGGSRSDGARPSGKPRGQGSSQRPSGKPRSQSSGKPYRDSDDRPRSGKPRRDGDDRGRGQSGGKPYRDSDDRPRSGKPRRDGDDRGRGQSGGKPYRDSDDRPRSGKPRRDGDERGRGQSGGKPRGKPRGDSRPSRDRNGTPRGGGRPDRAGREQSSYRGRDDRARSDRSPRGFDDRPERDTSNDLEWPEEIFDLELEPEVLKDLEAFGGRTETLAKHLLSVQVLAESDPEEAYQHAARVRDRVSRSGLARHTACIAAYRTGRFKEAIKEESAYRRINGKFDLVPIAADSERGLGRPQRALAMVAEYEGEKLDSDTRTELLIVGGGARRDLGDDEAARVLFQKAVRAAHSPMAMARSRYALGELLASTGDVEQAKKWLQSAVDVDEDSAWTDAAEVLDGLA